jgi:hypothetical protein
MGWKSYLKKKGIVQFMSFISELKQTGSEKHYEHILCETVPIDGSGGIYSRTKRKPSALLASASFCSLT